MDKEVRDKHYRIVGLLEAIDVAMQKAQAMPCDEATRHLIEVGRVITNKIVLSAWGYAEQQTSQGKPADEVKP